MSYLSLSPFSVPHILIIFEELARRFLKMFWQIKEIFKKAPGVSRWGVSAADADGGVRFNVALRHTAQERRTCNGKNKFDKFGNISSITNIIITNITITNQHICLVTRQIVNKFVNYFLPKACLVDVIYSRSRLMWSLWARPKVITLTEW